MLENYLVISLDVFRAFLLHVVMEEDKIVIFKRFDKRQNSTFIYLG